MAGWFQLDVMSDGLTIITTAYTIGDCLDNVHTLADAGIAAGGSGMIHSATMVDDGDVMGASIVHIYTATLTVTNNAAFAPSDADAANKVGEIWLPTPRDLGGVRDCHVQLQIPYVCAGGSADLFAVWETRTANAVFTAVDDLHLRLICWRDS